MPEPDPIEGRLRALEEEGKQLRQLARRRVNPFEDATIQLALEAGGTVSARTRRTQMTATGLISSLARFPDGATNSLAWGLHVPSDWVLSTDMTLNVQVRPRANGVAVMRSYITAYTNGETEVPYNIEDAGVHDITGTTDVLYVVTRTITGTDLRADDAVYWSLARWGGHGSDTMGGNLDAFYGAWMEYTAFF